MTYAQSYQARSLMECIAGLIPQEGVDYDVEIIFTGGSNTNVKMRIVAKTDKGAYWRDYVTKMISKYPPTGKPIGEALPDKIEDVR